MAAGHYRASLTQKLACSFAWTSAQWLRTLDPMSPHASRTAFTLCEELHVLLWATASFGRLLIDMRPEDRAVHDGIGDALQAFMAIVDAVDRDDIEGVRRSAGRALVAVEALWAATQEARLATPELRFDLLAGVLRRLSSRVVTHGAWRPRRTVGHVASRFQSTAV